MGGGSYSYDSAATRAFTKYKSASTSSIFTSRSLDRDLNIHSKVRECCETDEHPEAYPIIIGLDVTGSMGSIPATLIKEDLPKMMMTLIDAGIPCPQLCFVACGDDRTDQAPFQAGQFEANDELMEKWLKKTYLEGSGGGNGGESYSLAHYFAATCTSCDAIKKRGARGCLITIGDEPNHNSYRSETLEALFGNGCEKDMSSKEIYRMAKEAGWEIYHINVLDYSGKSYSVHASWDELIGEDHVIDVPCGIGGRLSDVHIDGVISDIALSTYQKYHGTVVDGAVSVVDLPSVPDDEKPIEIEDSEVAEL